MNKKIYLFSLSIGLLSTLAGIFIWIKIYNTQLLTPVNIESEFSFLKILGTSKKQKKLVYGFLPYWNLKKVELQKELTHLSYFSLTIQADGSVRLTEEGFTEPGYSKLQSDEFLDLLQDLDKQNTKLEIVLTQFNNDSIVHFLNSEKSQDKLLETLDSVLLAYPFSGVNIDIEYSGESTDKLRSNFVNFVEKIDRHLDEKDPNIKLSIDVYGSAASRKMIWDLEQIGKHVDYVIMMAYDYHRRNSVVSGPVAPLFGGDSLWDSDITEHLNDLIDQVPSNKILLGVPFYGYEWRTTSREDRENTYPNSGSTASFERIQEILNQKEKLEVQEHWNDDALSPYITYKQNGAIFTIYYENSRSLFYKLDLIEQLDLAGVAIWALGYEGDNRELWDVIENKL
ncbi:MAG: glycosyl hydrolase family 18 protein [Patescibacteria group bacterium]